jgi:hypothetical protein
MYRRLLSAPNLSYPHVLCERVAQKKGGAYGARRCPGQWALDSLDVPLLEAYLRYSPTCHEVLLGNDVQ